MRVFNNWGADNYSPKPECSQAIIIAVSHGVMRKSVTPNFTCVMAEAGVWDGRSPPIVPAAAPIMLSGDVHELPT